MTHRAAGSFVTYASCIGSNRLGACFYASKPSSKLLFNCVTIYASEQIPAPELANFPRFRPHQTHSKQKGKLKKGPSIVASEEIPAYHIRHWDVAEVF